MVLVLIVAAAACAFGVIASLVISWASRRSGLWNIGFAAVIVVASAGALLLMIVLVMRRFSN
jgi:hypothetical protein